MCGEEREHIELVALSDTSSKAKTTSCVAGSLWAHKFKFLFIRGTWFFVCLFVEIDLSFGLFTGWFSSEVLRLLQENHASIHTVQQ
jgi:hypothetical protein